MVNDSDSPTLKAQGQVHLRKEYVLHIPDLGFDDLVRYSPISTAKNAVGMALDCNKSTGQNFLKMERHLERATNKKHSIITSKKSEKKATNTEQQMCDQKEEREKIKHT